MIVAAVAGALVLAMGVATARSRASRSLMSAGVLAPRDRILVADVADRTGDPTLAAAITEAIRIELTQSPVVQVLSVRQVRSTLEQMERSPDLALDDTLAREIAIRDGVKAIVSGSVSRVAGRYTITGELLGAETGDLLTAVEETAADSNDVIPAVGRLADALRGRLGESLRSIRQTAPLAQVTTTSLEALRLYTEGVRATGSGDRERGVRLLVRATQLDTGFASAYRALGMVYGAMAENGRGGVAMKHALAHQDRLPFTERYLTKAGNASGHGDHAIAIEAYRTLLGRYPDDVRALNNLGYEYRELRQYAVQDSLLTHALAIDSSIPAIWTGLVMTRLNLGNFEGARQVLDRVERRFPGMHLARLAEIYLAAGRQDWETAERKARERIAAAPDDSLDALDSYETMAGIVMTRGRLAEGERYSREVVAMAVPLKSPTRYYSSALRLAYLELRYRHASEAAIAIVESAFRRFPLEQSLGRGSPVRRPGAVLRRRRQAGTSPRPHRASRAHEPRPPAGAQAESPLVAWRHRAGGAASRRGRDGAARGRGLERLRHLRAARPGASVSDDGEAGLGDRGVRAVHRYAVGVALRDRRARAWPGDRTVSAAL